MVYTELVKKASIISFEAHKKDYDKGGYPYFMHPLTLALALDDEDSCCVALLHDVIEDKGEIYSFDYLKDKGFNDNIINALKLLTHDSHIEYTDYIKTIASNEIARNVKLLDLKHNTNLTRVNGKKPWKYDTYLWAIEYLENYKK